MSCQNKIHDAVFATQPYASVHPAMVIGQPDGVGAYLRSFTRLLPDGLHELVRRIESAGGQAFLVGGLNRDLYRSYLAGQPPESVDFSDLDVEVFGLEIDRMLPLVRDLANQLGGKVNSIDRRFQVSHLYVPGVKDHIDIAIARRERTTAMMRCDACGLNIPYPDVSDWDREHRHCPACGVTGKFGIANSHQAFEASFPSDITIPEAAERRDFTINSLYLSITHNHLVDPYNGIQDLHRGVVRMVNPNTFVEDPVRFIRAARFAGVLRFTIDPELRRLAGAYAYTFRNLTHNLVRTEYEKLFGKGGRFSGVVEYLALSGWMPGVSDLQRLLANTGRLDAWIQEKGFASVTQAFPLEYCPPEKRLTRRAALTAAILLHGQPVSATLPPDDGMTIKPPHPSVDVFRSFTKCRDKEFAGAVARFSRSLDEPVVNGDNLLLIGDSLGDTLSMKDYLEARSAIGLAQDESAAEVLQRHGGRVPPPLVNGNDAIQLLRQERGLGVGNGRGCLPPPVFGKLIKSVRHDQLTGALATRDDAERRLLELADSMAVGAPAD